MKLIVGFFLLVGVVLASYFIVDQPKGLPVEVSEKIQGVSLVNPPKPVAAGAICDVQEINAQWVAVIPFGFSMQGEPKVYFDTERQWWGERVEGTRQLIRDARACGLSVMLKPHVWLRRNWIGEYTLDREEDWQEWESAYQTYILTFAQLAEEEEVPLFCIGTEYKLAVKQRPRFWETLIGKVKEVYSGKLTYAANWDDYDQVTFWEQLDYIGVDAYFPLEVPDETSLEAVRNSWSHWRKNLRQYSRREGKPVLFTEYGYQSKNGALHTPWGVPRGAEHVVNMDVQVKGYEALYQELWSEPWFAGGFLWKWHLNATAGGLQNADFTPQGKPVENVIRKWYQKD